MLLTRRSVSEKARPRRSPLVEVRSSFWKRRIPQRTFPMIPKKQIPSVRRKKAWAFDSIRAQSPLAAVPTSSTLISPYTARSAWFELEQRLSDQMTQSAGVNMYVHGQKNCRDKNICNCNELVENASSYVRNMKNIMLRSFSHSIPMQSNA